MMTNQTIKRPREEETTEEEYDEKENILIQETEESGTEKEAHSEPVQIRNEETVIQLSRYWPEGSGVADMNIYPKDTTLLYLYSLELESNGRCEIDEITELVRMYEYDDGRVRKYFSFDTTSREEVSILLGDHNYRNLDVVMRHVHCPLENKCYRNTHDGKLRGKHVKIFAVGKRISFYLKIDENTLPLIPNEFDCANAHSYLLEAYFNGSMAPNRGKIDDTFDFPEAQIPEGFKLALRDYQLRSISWMRSIEGTETTESNSILHNIQYRNRGETKEEKEAYLKEIYAFVKFKLGDTPYYLGHSSYQPKMTTSPSTISVKPLRFYVGILADDTGSGKTITTLGLIHSSPFSDEQQAMRLTRFQDSIPKYFQSRASCIICPSNIYKQWLDEAKRCNPNFKIYGLSTIHDHKKVSFKDLVEADIVIVSRQFLINVNYTKITAKLLEAKTKLFDLRDTKGAVILKYIHFYRIIIDEFHEIFEAKPNIKEAIKIMRGDYYWGLTGTPKIVSFKDHIYLDPSERLFLICAENGHARHEFNCKHMKRNVPNLQLPEIQNETVWIDLTPHELNMLQWNSRSSSIKEQVMMCSHYQLSERETLNIGDFVPVEEAQKRMSIRKEKEIEQLKRKLIQKKLYIQGILEEDPTKDVSSLESDIKSTEIKLQSAQNSFNYFQNVFKVIGDPNANECRICLDTIAESSLSILPCSHLFCFECILPYVQRSCDCPLCRSKITNDSEIYRIRIKEPDQKTEIFSELDTSKYSSKLIGLYRYITDLIRTDQNARIILFLQFNDLANFIEKSLKELKIEFVRVAGTVFQRENAIAKFKKSKDVRLIMMSSENSVSGINLTEATHVILLHPFWTDKGEAVDLAYEKQGISRAYRFGLNHPLKIVRFAVRGTIEEEITLRRQNITY